MASIELIMPKMGESIMEATILTWLKKPGDKIEQDESVLEVATDKVDTEVPSTHAGILKEILAERRCRSAGGKTYRHYLHRCGS
jgi:2-oxoglutarate dehydrogenase E2 component (dihydrolipoamide succinyltransferase)